MENNIPKLIRDKRKKLRLTQREFGEKIGKSRCDIANYENSRAIPPGDVLLRIQEINDVRATAPRRSRSAK